MQHPAPAHVPGTSQGILRLFVLVYLPALLMYIGWGMAVPVLPLFAENLGATVAAAGIVVAIKGFGPLVFNVPAGMLISRFGNRRPLILFTIIVLVVGMATGLSHTVVFLAAMSLITGGLQSVWIMSRVAYVRAEVGSHQRGRAISAIGGFNRIGSFIGPVIGGFLAQRFGYASVFFAQAAFCLAVLCLILFQKKYVETEGAPPREAAGSFSGVWSVLRSERRTFLSVGWVTIAFQIVRSARQLIFPLWGEAIGLNVAHIGLVVGISSAIDMTLFYPAGLIMDRRGRKWAAVPSLLILSSGMLLIPLCHSFATLLVVGLLVGLGNGLGSGIVMTLGTDLAPERQVGDFLGLWFLVSAVGGTTGPAILGGLAGALALGPATLVTGTIGIVGAIYLFFFVKETLGRKTAKKAVDQA